MKKITCMLLAFALLATTFVSCKKDEDNSKAVGTASADLKIGSAASVSWVAATATATKSGASYTITAVGSTGTLLLKLDNVTAAGTYTLTTATRWGSFATGTKTYATTNGGGGNVIITTITSEKIEGTFLCEMFDGTTAGAIYANMGNGKFSATF